MHSRSPCTLLVLREQRFARFLTMVPNFNQRLRQFKELRTKQSELIQLARVDKGSTKSNEEALSRVGNLLSRAGALMKGVNTTREARAGAGLDDA